MKKSLFISFFALFLVILPLCASAQTTTNTQFQSDGIFGCNQIGAAASSVGTFSASGVYVPVADAAVILNTGYLVYLFCSLRPLVSALSESASAGLVAKIMNAITNGNNGNPQFSVNADAEDYAVAANKFIQVLQQDNILNPLDPALQGGTQNAIVQQFTQSTQQANAILKCPYSGNLGSLLSGQTFSWAGLDALRNPACNPIGAYSLASNLVNGYVSNAVQDNVSQRQMGNGFYPITTTDQFGNVNIVTPGSMILAQANQALGAGLLKTINAQDIGQLVNALFAGIGAQAVTSPQGLTGMTQPINSTQSYIGQMVTAASANASASIINTTNTVLSELETTTAGIKAAVEAQRALYTAKINQLYASESDCWNRIIANVCVGGQVQYSSSGTATCTAVQTTTSSATQTIPPAITLTVSTSTYGFANAVILAEIAPGASAVDASYPAVLADYNAVQSIAASIGNSSSQDVQTLAIKQLEDQFVAIRASTAAARTIPLPSTSELSAQQAKLSDLGSNSNTSLNYILTNAVARWNGNTGQTDPNTGLNIITPWDGSPATDQSVGWCPANPINTSDPSTAATLAKWISVWSN